MNEGPPILTVRSVEQQRRPPMSCSRRRAELRDAVFETIEIMVLAFILVLTSDRQTDG